ncbi:uncharacterized protein [Rutidosis leptorrhynchoides]|uniref:uncharacterized protein n=1 Tax=Rutidosis leptorrhynchoides TaxID=125765 RepID=UPI003A98E8A8
MYLCASRPDLACTVKMMSCYNVNPSKQYDVYVRRIVRYVKYSLELGIWFERGESSELMTFSDASYANVNLAAKQAEWIKKILTDIGELKQKKVTIYCDSSAAISMADVTTR